ncbi:MAG TPA: PilZ domain-containing protein [Spirochaetia bacterium]|nr:PilZ domain-containing protein [Spirochaetia bacterium]
MHEERRRGSRVPLDAEVELSGGGKSPIKATGVNISKSGLLCTTDEAIDNSTEKAFQVGISLPTSGEKVEFGGVIVRAEKQDDSYKTGIIFSDVDEQDKLDKFLMSIEIPSGDDDVIELP